MSAGPRRAGGGSGGDVAGPSTPDCRDCGHLPTLDPEQGRGYIFAMPRRSSKNTTPGKLASRIKRRWRIVLMRKTGEVLGTVDAADAQAAERSLRSSSS